MLNVGHVFQYLLRAAEEFPDLVAIEDGAEVVSYAELAARAQRIAAGLRAHGADAEVCVALALEEPRVFCEAMFGAWLAGAAVLPIASRDASDAALGQGCRDTHVRVLIASSSLLPRMQRALSQYAHELSVFVVGAAPPAYRAYEGLQLTAADEPALPAADAPVLQLPALSFSNRQLLAHLQSTERMFPALARQRVLCPHACGTPIALSALLASIRDGATLVTTRRFDATLAGARLAARDIAALWSTPRGYRALLDAGASGALRCAVAMGPLDRALAERVQRAFEAEPYQCYGPAEALFAAYWIEPGAYAEGSVGKLQPGLELKVLDGHAADGCGPLALRGPSLGTRMDADGDGWFISADIGRSDEQQRAVFVSERAPNAIYRDDEWQSPSALEAALFALPEVVDACVLRRGDLITGETALAVVELQAGCSSSANQLHQRVMQQAMPLLRVPDAYAIVKVMPRRPTGQPARALMAKQLPAAVAAPNIERGAPGLEPWLVACGLGRERAHALHELVEAQRSGAAFAGDPEAWSSVIDRVLGAAEDFPIERAGLVAELERLGYLAPSVPASRAPSGLREDGDRNTCYVQLNIPSDAWSARLAALELRLARSFEEPVSIPGPLAARVALITRHEAKLSALPADPGQFLVVGRHSQASLRAHAENLSLRHLLLIGRPGAVTELIPLVAAERVRAWTRPLPARLAARCIAFDLDCALLLIAPELDGAAAPVLQRPAASGLGPARKPARPRTPARSELREWGEHTIVTIARDLSVVPDEPAGHRPLALSVTTAERSVSVGVREEWLEQGLILGRKPEKCSHRAFHDVMSEDDHISRCHVYLRREGDQVVFYDTASTSGLWLGEDCVQRVAVPAPRAACEGAGDAALINPERIVITLTEQVSVTLSAQSARA